MPTLHSIDQANDQIDDYTYVYITAGENEEMFPATNVLELSDHPDLGIEVVNIRKQLLRHTRFSVFDGIVQGMLWVMIL